MIAAVLVFGLISFANAECGKNEEVTEFGYDCMTCQNRFFVKCPPSYEKKCRCKEGYIRSNDGTCMTMDECIGVCGPNEELTNDCITCQNRMLVKCALNLEVRCRCKDGYIRSDDGSCISDEECLLYDKCRSMGTNATYYEDTMPCPKSCRDQPDIICLELPGCGCKEGYVWDGVSHTCVDPIDCPSKCS